MNKETLNVYIGFDSRNYGQTLAYEVCKRSILKNLNTDKYSVNIKPLVLKYFQQEGIYTRKEDPLATTEFTYTRFLVPYLNNYEGKALFCDSDFLWECCVSEAFNYLQSNKAVACVKHDYKVKNNIKMDGQKQTVYPRKNWSSLMVFNCDHISTKNLTLDAINTKSPKYLHRMEWANDEEIGEIPYYYNYLVGIYDSDDAKVYHYTNGGPWHSGYENCQYSEKWLPYLTEEETLKLNEYLAKCHKK